jgi:uncharacterized protein (TIGR02118 family)
MTYRIVILGRRDEELSHDECISYLEQEHIPLVKQLPGLQRLTTSIPLDPDEMGYDEMAQLYFKTADDLDAAMESDEWQRILEDAENFANVEETVVITVTDQTMRYQAVPETL